jgi:2-polyprenyl-3-methyl-5-hydroxy-6-metoxy-1,4-benzoquinol methylase
MTVHPTAVPVSHTLDWMVGALLDGQRKVLEVGCGRGELASAMVKRGLVVTAIDSDPEAVAAAKARGVPAIGTHFLDFDATPFHALIFTRSLHHMGALQPVIDRASHLVAKGGTLLLDEFAYERADAATAAWFYDERERLSFANLIQDDEWLPGADPLERWQAHHTEHRVHEGNAMRLAAAKKFRVTAQEYVPYLYRWFADRLPADANGAREVAALYEAEREGIAAGRLKPIGFRVVARALIT